MAEKQVETLLKNMHKVIQKHGIDGLNDALVVLINQNSDNSDEVAIAFKVVSIEFKIEPKDLMLKHARGHLTDAKQVCYCLLHNCLQLSVRKIARIFNIGNSFTSVFNGIDRLRKADPNLKQDKDFVTHYETAKNNLLTALNNKV
jgi:chromosomal replication initiation ATPase DnaA